MTEYRRHGFKCQICYLEFNSMDTLTEHFSSDHSESNILFWKLLGSASNSSYGSRSYWIEHIQDEQSTKGGFYSEGTGTFVIS